MGTVVKFRLVGSHDGDSREVQARGGRKMREVSRLGLLMLACMVLPSCGGGSSDAPEAVDADGGAMETAESGTDIAEEDVAPQTSPLLEFTGSIISSGTDGLRMVSLRTDDGSSVGLVGELGAELARLSGAVVTVRGNDAPAPADRGLDVMEYEVMSINGETPSVGVLERRGEEYWLGGDPSVHLIGIPDALTQAVGAKIWVTGSSSANGVTVQSYGIIRPI